MKENTVLTTQELSKYLKLNEKTILKMAQSGQLPGFKIGTQWRFYLSIVDEYLQDKVVGDIKYDFGRLFKETEILPLSRFIEKDSICLNLKTKTKINVLKELSVLVCKSDIGVSKNDVFLQLQKREEMLSTVITKGIAVPHSRNPRDDIFKKPGLVVARSIDGVYYDSSTEKVHLFFVPCAPDVVIHLKLLSKLANLFKNKDLYSRFMTVKTKDEMFSIFLEYEQKNLFGKN